MDESLVRLAYDTVTEGIAINEMVMDSRGEMVDYRVVSVNRAFAGLADFNHSIPVVGSLATELYAMSVEQIREFWLGHRDKSSAVVKEFRSPLTGKWFEISTSPFVHGMFVTSFHDITDRKLDADRVLQIVEAAPLALVFVNREGQIQSLNAEAERCFGYRREELLGQDLETLLPERYRNHHPALRSGFFLHPSVRLMGHGRELYARRKDGSEFPVEVGLSPLKSLSGQGVLATVVDISARKLAEAQREQSEHFLRVLTDSVPGMISYWTKDLVCQFANTPYEQTFDVTPGPGAFAATFSQVEGVLAGTPQHFERSLSRTDGSTTYLWCQYIPHRKVDKVDGFFVLITDITPQKLGQLRQLELEAQLQQSQKMESIGMLAGGIAHDVNNVLSAISSVAAVHSLRAAKGSPEEKAFETILKAVQRAGATVGGLLNFARKSNAERVRLNLNALIRDQVLLMEHSTFARVALVANLDPELGDLEGDPAAIALAVMNLCINAVDAMAQSPRAPTLTITTRTLQDSVVVEVVDNGSGMSEHDRQHAVEPYFTTKAAGKGTGLGLSLVNQIARNHGGRMEIESEQGQGTLVRLTFPRVTGQASPVEGPEPVTAERAGKSILVVDDEPMIRESLHDLLSALGHHVLEAKDGEAALELLAAERDLDLVILDLNMPGLGGRATLHQIRREKPSLAVIVTTGLADEGVLELVREVPLTSLLPKPLDLPSLLSAIRAF